MHHLHRSSTIDINMYEKLLSTESLPETETDLDKKKGSVELGQ